MSNLRKRKVAAVRKLFEQRKQVATSHFAVALERFRQERVKDGDMQAFLSEYRGRYQTDVSTGIPAGFVKGWVRFLSSLEDASRVQRLQTDKAEQHVEDSRAQVISHHLRVRAGEKLEQRLTDSVARKVARKERRDLDELSNRIGR